jgi:hypothetical protein
MSVEHTLARDRRRTEATVPIIDLLSLQEMGLTRSRFEQQKQYNANSIS